MPEVMTSVQRAVHDPRKHREPVDDSTPLWRCAGILADGSVCGMTATLADAGEAHAPIYCRGLGHKAMVEIPGKAEDKLRASNHLDGLE